MRGVPLTTRAPLAVLISTLPVMGMDNAEIRGTSEPGYSVANASRNAWLEITRKLMAKLTNFFTNECLMRAASWCGVTW
jgi:hypothetical protein